MFTIESQHFLTGEELSQAELTGLLELAESMRTGRETWNRNMKSEGPLLGKTLALVFEKPSLRTRVSFTVGAQELGGDALVLDSGQKKTEDPEDTIRVLQGMVHGMMLRTFDHGVFARMVPVAQMPMINGLSDQHHPCQAIADLQTLKQYFGNLKGLKLAYVGDGNNVLHSLLLMLPWAGVDVHFACPDGFQPDSEVLDRARARADQTGARIVNAASPAEAVHAADAVYTDVWTSMGQEAGAQEREKAFAGYQLNLNLFSLAKPTAIALHCLPMVKGKEITSDVVEHPRSALFAQAANRLHAQKALMFGIYNGIAKSKSAKSLNMRFRD